eukprot:CAMPEP_0175041554 /NCGR_PEP_ID=MMETSP0052_2-20121109/1986_1 /TAXON_ID=51329 ORGANISM="Polytomella parva, Strain SAG 63-3" /NCGR_SAMPLE_ID=MMETSP0052_2 /ASSEMBLY_ACC=CAM_ASM_000194 /LENGTH=748 /DNA_ID=CAMNT_0016304095 /DNA_START=7 /DNA_END=2250 /DNA_ORIENTATION=+
MTREDTLPTRPMPKAPVQKIDFNSLKAPSGYIPGLGRGAAGFTTRSDIGPARGAGPGDKPGAPGKTPGKDDDEAAMDDTKFDEFLGNDAGLFAQGEYDEEDKEADNVWESVDNFMDDRRKEQRERRLKETLEQFRRNNPKITEQFADLKRKLSEVSESEWEAIPDIGDYTIKKPRRIEAFTPVPDSILSGAATSATGGPLTSVSSSDGTLSSLPGMASGIASALPSDLTAIGSGRGTVLGLKLDRMADSVSGQTVVDVKGYLTDLKSVHVSSDAEISDIKRTRQVLRSVIQSNPTHAPGWIAVARLEEVAGNPSDAKQLALRGCELCPANEDIWLEAARLHDAETARALLARGVSHLPVSVKLWLAAAKLESDADARSRVLRKALERIPTSVVLWKAAVDLGTGDEDAKVLLSRAVECCPQAVELWLALARLETYDAAKKVLNRARRALPLDRSIWVTAARLEETNGATAAKVALIIQKAVKTLVDATAAAGGGGGGGGGGTTETAVRDAWLAEAEQCAAAKPPMPLTCHAIVRAVHRYGIDDEDVLDSLSADAEEYLKRGAVEVARALYVCALDLFPSDAALWRAAAALEKIHGSAVQLIAILDRAVTHCPESEVLWLMLAKERWVAGDVTEARRVLEAAFAHHRGSESVWLAAFKLEFETGEQERARGVMAKARADALATVYPKVWLKSAIVERELAGPTAASLKALLEEGLKKFPTAEKLHLMLAQLEEARALVRFAGKAGGMRK